MPHPVTAPRVAPAARRPAADGPQLPVFIDQSGLRRRTLQGVGLVVGCVCLGYLVFVGTLAGGLWQPVGTRPPSTNAPAPSVPAATEPVDGPDAPARAGDHADRADRDDRPPTGRSVPPAGGPEK